MKLTLGTAQLGLPKYGRINATGCPDEANSVELIQTAVDAGVRYIDSARAYGLSEERVGNAVFGRRSSLDHVAVVEGTGLPLVRPVEPMQGPSGPGEWSDKCGINPLPTIITKLSPLAWLDSEAGEEVVRAAVEASVYQSCYNLRVRTLPVLMLHRWDHHDSHDGLIWNQLKEYQEAGLIHELGASVYSPDEGIDALRDPEVRHLQIPFNLLDHRWVAPQFKAAMEKRSDVTVHVRSSYLQGILLAGPGKWPIRKGFDAKPICDSLEVMVEELGRQNRADLCLAYLNSCPFVSSIVVGVETIEQLKDNFELIKQPPLKAEQREQIESRFLDVPRWVVNPAEWS